MKQHFKIKDCIELQKEYKIQGTQKKFKGEKRKGKQRKEQNWEVQSGSKKKL